jgi:molybdopterin/thiamine biosynthesis adenylyltransferase/rhodanese-related sulfurtransferase
MLSDLEKQQFSRQIKLPGFGEEKQVLLKNAHVVIIGIGGLGNPVAQYLAAAGVGKLTLVDHDLVELHNLHRQPLFGIHDIGLSKADRAAEKLCLMYPSLSIRSVRKRFDEVNCLEIANEATIVADCTDNFQARYAIDAFAEENKIPVLFGAINWEEGRISLFHGTTGTRYKDVYPQAPISSLVRDCAEEGVLGPLAGMVGAMMASSIITFLTTGKSNLDGTMLHIDANSFQSTLFEIPRKTTSHTHLHHFLSLEANLSNVRLVKSEHFELIDVREWHEHEEFNLGGKCLPAGNIREWEHQLDTKTKLLFYCNHGYQSSIVAQYISALLPESKTAHLKGGLEAWRELLSKAE